MTKQRAFILFLLLLILLLVVGVIFRDFIRKAFIVPIIYLAWVVSNTIRSIDQIYIWFFWMFIVLLLMLRGLATYRPPQEVGAPPKRRYKRGREGFWEIEISLLTAGETPSRYAVHEVRRLFLAVVAYTHHLTIGEIEDRLKVKDGEEIRRDPDLQDIPLSMWKRMEFEDARLADNYPERFLGWLRNLFLWKKSAQNTLSPRMQTLRDMIEILEDQLEIKND